MSEMPESVNGEPPPYVAASVIPPAPHALPPPKHRRGRAILMADEREWSVPPLLLEQVYGRGRELFVAILNGSEVQHMVGGLADSIYELTHMALARNYPGLTLDDVKPLLDMECLYEVLTTIFNLSGFRELLNRLGLAPPTTPVN